VGERRGDDSRPALPYRSCAKNAPATTNMGTGMTRYRYTTLRGPGRKADHQTSILSGS